MRKQHLSGFGASLSKAIKSIAKSRLTTIPEIEREIARGMIELGYPMQNYTVNGWRRGYVPSEPQQIAWLVRWCIEQGFKDPQWAASLLKSARYPQRAELLQELFPGTVSDADEPQDLPAVLFLPPRPRYLIGRAKGLSTLRRALEKPGTALAISGLPGVGKSALAAELVHQLTQDASGNRLFPDGIIFLSAQDIHGSSGLQTFLINLLACFQVETASNPSIAEIKYRVSHALAGKRALFLLDDIQPDFPLNQALEILLTHSRSLDKNTLELTCCTVLVTSRAVPQSPRLSFHLPLDPLKPTSALELLRRLIDYQNPQKITKEAAKQLCKVVGYLPLALELAAQVIQPDSEIVNLLFEHPLRVDTNGELSSRIAQLIATLPNDTQQRFIRLAPLATEPFSLAQAAALMQLPDLIDTEEGRRAVGNVRRVVTGDGVAVLEVPEQALVAASLDLVRLRQSSLLEVAPSAEGSKRYQIAPLPQAVNAEILHRTYAETVALARQYQGDAPHLLQNKDRLLQAVTHAWVSGLYSQVIDLVEGMFNLLGRLPYALSEEILRWGIEASHALHDRYYWVRFTTRIGKLKFYQGQYKAAQQAYEESLEIGRSLLQQPAHRQRSQFWIQWANLYHIAYMSGDQEAAERFLQPFLHWSMESGNPTYVASAFVKKAYLAWLFGDTDKAAGELNKSISLSPLQTSSQFPSIALENDLTLARLSQDYEQATRIARAVEAKMRDEMLDEYWLADQKDDQTRFAIQQHRFEDARKIGLEGLLIATKVGAPVLVARLQEQLALIPT